jgi:hypothetical protein
LGKRPRLACPARALSVANLGATSRIDDGKNRRLATTYDNRPVWVPCRWLWVGVVFRFFRQGREVEERSISVFGETVIEEAEQGNREGAGGIVLIFFQGDGTGDEMAVLVFFPFVFFGFGFCVFDFLDEFELLLTEGFELGV